MSEKRVLKNGIWIKEQNGLLTMGLIGNDDFEVEIGEKTSLQLFALELELQEALYGENSIKFNPKNVNFEKLVQSILRDTGLSDSDIATHFTGDAVIKGDYDMIFDVFKAMIQKSSGNNGGEKIYINASVADNSLCVVYRDDVLCRKAEGIDDIKKIIEKELGGSIKIIDSVKNPYIDITIPEKA